MIESKISDLWQEICFLLHTNISDSISEELYEQKIVSSLEKMGWSEFKREIILKQIIQVGSSSTIVSDIIVKSLTNGLSFVIEVKKPSVNIETESNKRQLFSYMRQLKIPYGLLIGNKILIYYDGKLNDFEYPILLESIDINESDKNGQNYIKLFYKDLFNQENIECFAKNKIREINNENKYKELHSLLLSTEYIENLKKLITDNLTEEWDKTVIEKLLKNIEINITEKSSIQQTLPAKPTQMSLKCENLSQNVEIVFIPSDKHEFKKMLIKNKIAYIRILFNDGHCEFKKWRVSNFKESSNLIGNIRSRTLFRKGYVQQYGVEKAVFSIEPF